MIKYIWSKTFGKCIARCNAADAEQFIGMIRDGGFTTDPVRCEGDVYTVTIPESRVKKLRQLITETGIDCTVERLPGIPMLIYRYKRRPGILIGAILFFLIIGFSGRIIWDFEVTGNKNISDTEIISALEALGCGAGTIISDIDFDMLQNDCLIDAENLAWVSVNMDGNLARVEVREKRSVPLEFVPEKGRFANIVAAEDGVIELCKVKNGKSAVEQGDVVKKGELLITGVIDVGETDVRYEYAEGEVMARVYREIESYVPFVRTVQTPTGAKKSEISVKIFGNAINLSQGGSIDWALYGKIIEEEKLSLPFGITLPVWVKRTVYSEMHEETVAATETEALKLAREDATVKLRAMTEELQVLSVSESVTTDENGVRITLGVYGVTDISANLGFSASEGGAAEEKDKPQE